MKIVLGGSGLFSSKQETTSSVSPAQEAAIAALSPIQTAFAEQLAGLFGISRETTPAQGAVFDSSGSITAPQNTGVDPRGRPINNSSGGGQQLLSGATPESSKLVSGGPNIADAFANTLLLSPEEQALPGAVGRSGDGLASILRGQLPGLTQGFGLGGIDDVSEFDDLGDIGTFDSEAFANPIFRRFQEEVLPGIRSRAIQFGAPSGSREAGEDSKAAGRFATELGETLSRASTDRERARTQRAGASAGATTSRSAVQTGRETAKGNRNTQIGNILAILLPQIFGFETAGPQQAASTAALGRGLEGGRVLAPLDLLMQALSGAPRPQFGGGSSTTRKRDAPVNTFLEALSSGAQAAESGLFL